MIRAVDSAVVHQITSGQVVVDMLSIVKELVENSSDAGAKAITISVKSSNGQLEYVEITDNGAGIQPQDFESVALKNHTSKLDDFEGLRGVTTMGFRGEALNAISSMSKMEIRSATAESSPMGWLLKYGPNGQLESKKAISHPRGTTVKVIDLFHNLPVRRANLQKNYKREFQRMMNGMLPYFVILANVRLALFHTENLNAKKLMMKTNGNKLIKDNLVNIYGATALNGLEELKCTLEVDTQIIKIEGLLSNSSFGNGRSSKDRQLIYINGRPVEWKSLLKLANETYKKFNYLQFPVVIMNFTIDTAYLDVNVTPDKKIVMLDRKLEQGLFDEFVDLLEKRWNQQDNYVIPLNKKANDQVRTRNSTRQLSLESYISTYNSATEFEDEDDDERDGDGIVVEDEEEEQTETETERGDQIKKREARATMQEEETIDEDLNNLEMDEQLDEQQSEAEMAISQSASTSGEIAVEPSTLETGHREGRRNVKRQKHEVTQNDSAKLSNHHHKGQNQSSDGLSSEHNMTEISAERSFTSTQKEESASIVDVFSDTELLRKRTRDAQLDHVEVTLSLSPDTNKCQDELRQELQDYSKNEHDENADNCSCCSSSHSSAHETYIPPEGISPSPQIKFESSRLDERITCRINPENLHMNKITKFNEGTNIETSDITNGEECERQLTLNVHKNDFLSMDLIGQFNKGFIIVRKPATQDIFIVDQHASDEKYNFEKIYAETKINSQRLVIPEVLELNSIDKLTISSNLPIFEKNGFQFKFHINPETQVEDIYLIALPHSKATTFTISDLHELIYLLQNTTTKSQNVRPSKVRSMFAMRACRSSIMIGQALSSAKMSQVVKNLSNLDKPWNCPHGRPTMRHLVKIAQWEPFDGDYTL